MYYIYSFSFVLNLFVFRNDDISIRVTEPCILMLRDYLSRNFCLFVADPSYGRKKIRVGLYNTDFGKEIITEFDFTNTDIGYEGITKSCNIDQTNNSNIDHFEKSSYNSKTIFVKMGEPVDIQKITGSYENYAYLYDLSGHMIIKTADSSLFM